MFSEVLGKCKACVHELISPTPRSFLLFEYRSLNRASTWNKKNAKFLGMYLLPSNQTFSVHYDNFQANFDDLQGHFNNLSRVFRIVAATIWPCRFPRLLATSFWGYDSPVHTRKWTSLFTSIYSKKSRTIRSYFLQRGGEEIKGLKLYTNSSCCIVML